jgi:ribosomal protein L44E
MHEYCSECDTETPHEAHLEIREEGDQANPDRRAFSREPYRVRTCQACDTETAQRMNNAQQGSSA